MAKTATAPAEEAFRAYDASGKLISKQVVDPPPFTAGALRRAIPAHCFERSIPISFLYVAVDLSMMLGLYYLSTLIDASPFPAVVRWGVLWPLYWFFQGAVCTGIWVLAHECGHQAFSKYGWLNDTVGFVLHTFLLVPYYSWKESHHLHHANTGSIDRDEVFVPEVRASEKEHHASDVFEELPVVKFLRLIFALLLGWPLYLLMNVSSHPQDRFTSHFDPWAPIFKQDQRLEVMASDAGIVAMVSLLTYLTRLHGARWFVCTYFVPYLIVNNWLVMITLLQHTHPSLPHYKGAEWDWLRGALATVDRSFGFLDYFFHHIADTHVAHHLFSQIPHYHAEEATRAIIPVLKGYYAKDNRNALLACFADYSACRFVVRGNDIKGESSKAFWYRP